MLKVSVIIPTYNCGAYITYAIDSALRQTYKDFEIIVVDDGSTDNTKELLKPYIESSKIRYIYQENNGSASARNAGILNSQSENIAFLDADDEWLPEKLKKQIEYFDKNPIYDLVYCNAKIINDNGDEKGIYIKQKYFSIKTNEMSKMLLLKNFIPFSSIIIKRPCIDKIGLFNPTIKGSEDYDFLLRISAKYNIGYLDIIGVKYRISAINKSHDLELRHRETIKILSNFLKNMKLRVTTFALRKRLARSHYGLGYALFEKNEFKASGQALKRAIALWPFINFKLYILFVCSLLPKKGVHQLRILKRKVVTLLNVRSYHNNLYL